LLLADWRRGKGGRKREINPPSRSPQTLLAVTGKKEGCQQFQGHENKEHPRIRSWKRGRKGSPFPILMEHSGKKANETVERREGSFVLARRLKEKKGKKKKRLSGFPPRISPVKSACMGRPLFAPQREEGKNVLAIRIATYGQGREKKGQYTIVYHQTRERRACQ